MSRLSPVFPSFRHTWNVYGRPATIDGTTTLTYDANDVLLEKGVSGAYTEIEYGPTGRTCTMNGTAQVQCVTPLPGGSALARGPETIWHPDWLGSVRLGSSPGNRTVTFDRAFAPFGEAYDTVTGGTTNLSFTGLLQDSISGEYDTPARLLHPGQGRWISPDPAGIAAVDPGNPQSWNRYAYAVNNPLILTDPRGTDPDCSGDSYIFDSGGMGGTYNGGWGGFTRDACFSDSQMYQMYEAEQAQQILDGENSINFPMGTGNLFGDIWNALGLPSGLNCPQVGGLSNFLCGGINPIMDGMGLGLPPTVDTLAGMGLDSSPACEVSVYCTSARGTDFSHCGVQVKAGPVYEAYDGGPTGSIWWSTLHVSQGAGSAPGASTIYQQPIACSHVGCAQTQADAINDFDWKYNFILSNSNTAASLMAGACGAHVNAPSSAWGFTTY